MWDIYLMRELSVTSTPIRSLIENVWLLLIAVLILTLISELICQHLIFLL